MKQIGTYPEARREPVGLHAQAHTYEEMKTEGEMKLKRKTIKGGNITKCS